MYLETDIVAERLARVSHRAQASVAEGLAQITERVTAKLSGTIAAAIADGKRAPEPAREGERRGSSRFATGSQIHARRIPGNSFEVALENVSASGCRIEMLEECQVGEDVVTRLPDLEALAARVCWTTGRDVGLEFARPIHPAVFDALLERLAQPQPANA